ncbi:MAG: type II toxin-antitoxin system VapC family toxin [Caulobacteraceae bacterium]|nr:type II toxin-antitoxin system VapC family toxin [Caulobacter sp.]
MTLVVDASVAVKWVLPEPDSQIAREVVGTEPLVAPDFLMLECANVLAQNVRRRRLTDAQAQSGLHRIATAGVRLIPSAPLVAQAQHLALTMSASAYDALYLAVALAENVVLLTADARFAVAAEAAYPHAVRRL